MNEIQISKNITLKTDGFENFDKKIVPDLLRHVDIWLSNALGQEPFTSKKVEIYHVSKKINILQCNENEDLDYPECCNSTDKTFHIIFLTPFEDELEGEYEWYSWVYQFAHEYCHHLIDGPLKGEELHGLKWFEETICELSSIYCLKRMEQYCQGHQECRVRKYANSVEEYIKNRKETADKTNESLHSYINVNLSLLSEPTYHRDKYKHIAFSILDLFIECPALWRIILNFGDTCKWQELPELFKHLEETADNTYIEPLNELRIRLLGS